MSDALVGVLVLAALSAAAAVAAHLRTPRFGWACALSAATAATAFVALDALRAGYVDPFAPIAWVGAALGAGAVSAVVGLGVRGVRARRR